MTQSRGAGSRPAGEGPRGKLRFGNQLYSHLPGQGGAPDGHWPRDEHEGGRRGLATGGRGDPRGMEGGRPVSAAQCDASPHASGGRRGRREGSVGPRRAAAAPAVTRGKPAVSEGTGARRSRRARSGVRPVRVHRGPNRRGAGGSRGGARGSGAWLRSARPCAFRGADADRGVRSHAATSSPRPPLAGPREP